jgi:hypothetical protein
MFDKPFAYFGGGGHMTGGPDSPSPSGTHDGPSDLTAKVVFHSSQKNKISWFPAG